MLLCQKHAKYTPKQKKLTTSLNSKARKSKFSITINTKYFKQSTTNQKKFTTIIELENQSVVSLLTQNYDSFYNNIVVNV